MFSLIKTKKIYSNFSYIVFSNNSIHLQSIVSSYKLRFLKRDIYSRVWWSKQKSKSKTVKAIILYLKKYGL